MSRVSKHSKIAASEATNFAARLNSALLNVLPIIVLLVVVITISERVLA